MKKQFSLLAMAVCAVVLVVFAAKAVVKTDFRTTLGAVGIISKEKIVATKEITLTGELQILQPENLKEKKVWNEYWIKGTGENTVRINAEKLDTLTLVAGSEISVTGTMVGGGMQTTSDKIKVVSTRTPSAARITKPQLSKDGKRNYKVAVILFNFNDNPSQTYSPAYAKDVVYGNTRGLSVNDFYNDVSSGTFKLIGSVDQAGDVYGWYTLPTTQAGCLNNYAGAWRTLANQAASADGFDVNAYDLVFYNFPTGTTNCAWSGVASGIPVPNTPLATTPWVFINGDWTPVYVHELGHILGLNHASSFSCTDITGNTVSLSTRCSRSAFGDPFDTMGGTDGLYFNARHKDYLGFPAAVKEVTTTGTYTIKSGNAPIQSQNVQINNNAYGIRIPLGNAFSQSNKMYYYLESRDATNWDSSIPSAAQTGITIRLGINKLPGTGGNSQNFTSSSFLIDTHLGTSTFSDAPLQLGETYYDQDRNLKITYVSQSASGKVIKIEFMRGAINCSLQTPSFIVSPGLKIVTAGDAVTYQYAAASRDTGTNCPPRIFTTSLNQNSVTSIIPRFDAGLLQLSQNRTVTGAITGTVPTLPNIFSLQSYSAGISDIFDLGSTIFALQVDPAPCVPVIPTVSATQKIGGAGQTFFVPLLVTNNNPATCAGTAFRVITTDPYAPAGWVLNSQSVMIPGMANGQVGSATVSISAAYNAPPGTYTFPVSIEDVVNGVTYSNIATLEIVIQ